MALPSIKEKILKELKNIILKASLKTHNSIEDLIYEIENLYYYLIKEYKYENNNLILKVQIVNDISTVIIPLKTKIVYEYDDKDIKIL